jgi:hypothetical protein
MSDTCCTALTATGQPCRAHPRPGRDLCALHDPALADTIAEGRSKGGGAPGFPPRHRSERRDRSRRYPRLLDHLHVAELLSELFIEALNGPERFDTKRLQLLTNLARVLLKAVGVPRDSDGPLDRTEPSPESDHLLRIYPPIAPEVEALLDDDPPAAPTPEPFHPAGVETAAPDTEPRDHSDGLEQVPEQVLDRCATGLPAIDPSVSSGSSVVSVSQPSSVSRAHRKRTDRRHHAARGRAKGATGRKRT